MSANKYVLGRKIGSGGNKDVFEVEGADEIAIGVLKPGKNPAQIDEEIRLLERLRVRGILVVEVVDMTMHDDRPAVVWRKYAQGSKSVVRAERGRVRRVGSSEHFNEISIGDLTIIKKLMRDVNIKIDDLQFLIGADGHVVVADPLAVHYDTQTSVSNQRMIDLLIDAAKENVARRDEEIARNLDGDDAHDEYDEHDAS